MSGTKTCKTCGIPLIIGKGHVWNSDGTITQRRDPDHRMALIDSNGVNPLFANIEQLIGVPIEKMIIESKARATRAYISKLIVGAKGAIARVVGLERIIRRVAEQGRVMGYGDIKVSEFNWKELYLYCEIGNPYSLPLFMATSGVRPLPGQGLPCAPRPGTGGQALPAPQTSKTGQGRAQQVRLLRCAVRDLQLPLGPGAGHHHPPRNGPPGGIVRALRSPGDLRRT